MRSRWPSLESQGYLRKNKNFKALEKANGDQLEAIKILEAKDQKPEKKAKALDELRSLG